MSRAYRCQCGRPVFLRNSECLACHTPLGYVIDRLGVMPLAPAEGEGALPDTFTVFGDPHGKTYHRCANLMTPAACSWMVPVPREGETIPPTPRAWRPATASRAASRAPFPISRSRQRRTLAQARDRPSAA
jgi:hypothetical protein